MVFYENDFYDDDDFQGNFSEREEKNDIRMLNLEEANDLESQLEYLFKKGDEDDRRDKNQRSGR